MKLSILEALLTLVQFTPPTFRFSAPPAAATDTASAFELEQVSLPQPEAVVRHLAPDLLARAWVSRKPEPKKAHRQPACLRELFADRNKD